jgi:hypothetical protein
MSQKEQEIQRQQHSRNIQAPKGKGLSMTFVCLGF